MYRVVIIDDEPIITRGLSLIIQRCNIPCSIVGTAHDGAEGIALIRNVKPDIIVTDISMPGVDGLEMIQTLEQDENHYQFIILSGFLEFEYAKKAMALGVKHFISKPVEETDLYRAIGDAAVAIQKREKENQMLQQLENSMVEKKEQLSNYLLRDLLIVADETQGFVDSFIPAGFFPDECQEFICVLFQFSQKSIKYVNDLYHVITATIEKHLSSFLCVKHVFFQTNSIAVIIGTGTPFSLPKLKEQIQSLNQNLITQWGGDIAVGIGSRQERASALNISFADASIALAFRILRGEGSIVLFDETRLLSKVQTADFSKEIAVFQNQIKQMETKKALNTIDAFFEKFFTYENFTPKDLQRQILAILLSATKSLSVTEVQINDFFGRDVFSLQTISRFQTIPELKNWLKNIITSIIELQVKGMEGKNSIDKIMDYLDQNYGNEVSLHLLSEKFFLNPFYLNQLFKEKTGESYLGYLTTLRINKAKRLLENTDCKIYEIAQRVGYSDTRYFSRLFERNTGQKPSEYRKNK